MSKENDDSMSKKNDDDIILFILSDFYQFSLIINTKLNFHKCCFLSFKSFYFVYNFFNILNTFFFFFAQLFYNSKLL